MLDTLLYFLAPIFRIILNLYHELMLNNLKKTYYLCFT
nr:MAG TPA: hypothetical protein [Caudoviricetes sp.]